MARRFPIMTTVGAAFGFLFGQFGQILSAMWFPSLLYGLNLAMLVTARISGDDQPWLVYGELAVTLVLLQCILTVRFIDFWFENPEQTSFLGVRFGADELRILCASLLAFTIVAILLILTSVALGAAAYGLTWFVPPLQSAELAGLINWPASLVDWPAVLWLLLAIIFASGVAAAFYLWQRLSLFPAIVLVEHKLGLFTSWELTEGNGWRLGASFALTMLLVAHLMAFVLGIIVLLASVIVFSMPHAIRLDVMELFPVRMEYLASSELFPVLVLLLGVLALIFQSVYAGFVCRAYQYRWDSLHGIRPDDDEEPPTPWQKEDDPLEDEETEGEGPALSEAAAAPSQPAIERDQGGDPKRN